MNTKTQESKLSENLRFLPHRGEIHLADHRILMFNQAAVSSLRNATIQQVGDITAQMIFAKFGYESAIHDYKALDKLFPDLCPEERLALGPVMHGWCGLVKVVPEFLDWDRDSGRFVFKGRWLNSYEGQSHLAAYGVSHTPVCYSLTGYGSAWCSQFFGIDLLEIERKCIACGDPYCEWEVRPWNEWGSEANPWKESLTTTDRSIIAELFSKKREINTIKLNVNRIIEEKVGEKLAENTVQLKALCHDIKAPLQVALFNLRESLMSGDLKPTKQAAWSLNQAQNVLERFQKSGQHSEGTLSIDRKPVLLSDVLNDSLRLVADRIASKGIVVEKFLGHDVFSFTDPLILRDHVIINLLTNAIKFSPANATISISAAQIGPGLARITIRDRGIGIPKSVLKKIKRQRKIMPRRGTSEERGNGHGLLLANFFVARIGGRLRIVSVSCDIDPLNSGTCATIDL